MASRFRICRQIRDRKYDFAILGVSGLALRPFRRKWAGWPSQCSEWISGNSRQSAPHWAPWRASYRHVPQRTIPCFISLRRSRSRATRCGQRCFTHSGPVTSWNSLPLPVRDTDSVLKTVLFCRAYETLQCSAFATLYAADTDAGTEIHLVTYLLTIKNPPP